MRKSTGILLASGMLVTVALSGCTTAAPSCEVEWQDGGVASAVDVSGSLGGTLKTSFPLPLVQLGEATSTVVQAGDGPIALPGSIVEGSVTIYDGATGEQLTGGGVFWSVDREEPRVVAAAKCLSPGTRVVTVGPASVVFGPSAAEGVDDATIVSVLDITAVYPGRADGADRLPVNGMPTIALAPDGRPGFTFTNAPAPTDLVISVLKEGSGPEVQEGDTVVLQYTGVSWAKRTVFDTTWEKGVPAKLVAADASTTSDGSGVVPGFAKALIGQRVGSQVLVAIPPGLGYPAGATGAPVADDDTMVFVFDVLGIQEGD